MLSTLAVSLVASTAFEVVADESLLFVQVYKDRGTLLAGMSHDHVVRAGDLSGKVTVGRELTTCRATVTIPVRSLLADEPDLRRRLKLPDDLDEDDRSEIANNMLAGDQLDGERYPFIVLEVTSCKVGGEPERVNLVGSLTIRGETRPLSVPVELELDRDRLRARGTFTKRHTEFGFQPYSAALGALKNRDEITFVFDLVARRR